jgi:hypothetical protein
MCDSLCSDNFASVEELKLWLSSCPHISRIASSTTILNYAYPIAVDFKIY